MRAVFLVLLSLYSLQVESRLARGYRQKQGKPGPSPRSLIRFAPYVPAGGAYSSLRDMIEFCKMALNQGEFASCDLGVYDTYMLG